MNIPKKFTFFNGNNNLLKLTNINGDYYCTMPNVEANPIHSAVYDRMNVEHKLHTGKWKIVADLSPEQDALPVSKEPNIIFPFTFKHCSGSTTLYTANKIGEKIQVDWDSINGGGSAHYSMEEGKRHIEQGTWLVQSEASKEPEMVFPITIKTPINGEWVSYYLEEDSRNKDKVFMTSLFGIADNWKSFVKQCIKEGIWIVQSVGEQQTKDEIVEPVQEYGIRIDESGSVSGKSLTFGKIVNPDMSDLLGAMEQLIMINKEMLEFHKMQASNVAKVVLY